MFAQLQLQITLFSDYECRFRSGYSFGTRSFSISIQPSIESCYHTCLVAKQREASINGANYYVNGGKIFCWCAHNMTTISLRTRTRNVCFLREKGKY